MLPHIKNGLVAGLTGAVLTVCVVLIGLPPLCGPGVVLLLGAMAGHFTAQEEKPPRPKVAAALAGAMAGYLNSSSGLASAPDMGEPTSVAPAGRASSRWKLVFPVGLMVGSCLACGWFSLVQSAQLRVGELDPGTYAINAFASQLLVVAIVGVTLVWIWRNGRR